MKKQKGFLLIDVIFATFVVATALVGFMTAIVPVIKLGRENRSQVIAAQLAQEGIEVMRFKRDVMVRACGTAPCNTLLPEGDFYIDYAGVDCGSTGSLKINASGFYNCSSGTNTPFSRTITVLPGGKSIRSTVTWGSGAGKSIKIDATFSDWGLP